MRVLIADGLDPAALAKLRAAGIDVVEKKGLAGAELIETLQSCQGIIVRGATKVTGDVLRGSNGLKAVVRAGTGLDNVDVAVARERGVKVSNTPAANAVSVAELVFGLALALERHIVDAALDMRSARWEKTKYAGRELSGRTLGLLGFGRIGREVALRARAFAMEVIACDPVLPQWPTGYEWVTPVTLDELMAGCDVLSLHVPLTGESRGVIGTRELALMRKDAILVNASRGGVVDEGALLAVLTEGRIRGAALDVFEREPPGEHPLLTLPNVIATPHLGASTDAAQRRAGLEAAEIMIAALRG
ncbi:MAG TPA: hydroxyacid dehydrogenase [Candidatus Eisenbacteria bacterium]|nr:hydroxyacid dehydrogenase [Candidatus Eisenbacteria bacterium]